MVSTSLTYFSNMSTIVAVAGTGALGKAIIKELRSDPQLEVIVLSRQVPFYDSITKSLASDKPMQGKHASDLQVVAIDYSDPASVATIFDEHIVHTVICAIAVTNEMACQAQLNLIRAADQSASVQRFIPSDFGISFTEEQVKTFPLVAFKLAAAKLLKTTKLEYTLFHCGFFLDFFGHPKISNLKDAFPLVVDVENDVAAIPGDGEAMCVFTHTNDVAKFVVKALEMGQWPEHLFMSGDRKTLNEVVGLAEDVKGKTW